MKIPHFVNLTKAKERQASSPPVGSGDPSEKDYDGIPTTNVSNDQDDRSGLHGKEKDAFLLSLERDQCIPVISSGTVINEYFFR